MRLIGFKCRSKYNATRRINWHSLTSKSISHPGTSNHRNTLLIAHKERNHRLVAKLVVHRSKLSARPPRKLVIRRLRLASWGMRLLLSELRWASEISWLPLALHSPSQWLKTQFKSRHGRVMAAALTSLSLITKISTRRRLKSPAHFQMRRNRRFLKLKRSHSCRHRSLI